MGQEVVRQDVVQVSFDIDNSPLSKLQQDLNSIKNAVGNALGSDIFNDFNNGANKAADGLNDIKSEADNLKGSNPLDDMAEDANKAADGLGDVKAQAKGIKSPLDEAKDSAEKLNDPIKKSQKSSEGLKSTLKGLACVVFSKTISGLKTLGNSIDNIAKKAAGAAFTGLKKLAGISFKALATGVAAASAAIGGLVTKSVTAYADYEQLIGGVETLFKSSANVVEKYANDA